jgi:hypothetical protein
MRARGGPPLFAVSVTLIVLESTTISPEVVGAGPEPFSNVTAAPCLKLEPLITALIVLPGCVVSGLMLVTRTREVGVGVGVGVRV